MSYSLVESQEIEQLAKRLDQLIDRLNGDHQKIVELIKGQDQWLTKDQFCKQFNLSSETVLGWRKTGKIPSKKIGGVIFINLKDILR